MRCKSTLEVCGLALVCAQLSGIVAAGQSAAPAPAPNAPPSAGQGPTGRGQAPGGAAGAPQLPPLTPASVERAAAILAETRTAMGSDKVSAITTIVATGQTRRVRGDNLVPIEFEINIELPDKYVRKDEVPAEESEPTSTGFVGGEVVQFPAAPAGRPGGPGPAGPPGAAGRPGGPPPTPEQLAAQRGARLTAAKQDFARLMLGVTASSLATYPLTFGYAAQAAAPQGTAHVLDVRGEGNLALRLFINTETHLPIMVSWQAPPTNVVVTTPGQPAPRTVAPGAVVITAPAAPAASAPQDERDAYAKELAALRQKAQTTPIEYRLYYADYRDVDGVKLPFRLRRAIGADTTEETTFDRFRLNTKIDPRKFAVPRS